MTFLLILLNHHLLFLDVIPTATSRVSPNHPVSISFSWILFWEKHTVLQGLSLTSTTEDRSGATKAPCLFMGHWNFSQTAQVCHPPPKESHADNCHEHHKWTAWIDLGGQLCLVQFAGFSSDLTQHFTLNHASLDTRKRTTPSTIDPPAFGWKRTTAYWQVGCLLRSDYVCKDDKEQNRDQGQDWRMVFLQNLGVGAAPLASHAANECQNPRVFLLSLVLNDLYFACEESQQNTRVWELLGGVATNQSKKLMIKEILLLLEQICASDTVPQNENTNKQKECLGFWAMF